MITKQHVAITVWAMMSKGKSMEDIKKAIPYVVLPDAIRMFVGQRQPSHFEKHPSSEEISWMSFPEEQSLKELSKDNLAETVKWYLAKDIPAAVIGEDSDISTFDKYNDGLAHYHEIRTHLVQDIVLDNVLREKMILAEARFQDSFTVRHSGAVIDGKELRRQVSLFEELGFIKLAGIVCGITGELLDKEWFDTIVKEALYDAYPADMAHNTYRFMAISDEVDQRLKSYDFELTQEEKDSVYMAEDLDSILEAMYKKALEESSKEF